MFDFEKQLATIGRTTVLCIGDAMLDQYVYGEVSRVSPEAPTMVLAVGPAGSTMTNVGGAGNVACNIASLGARCIFLGVIGDDREGRTLKSALSRHKGRLVSNLAIDRSRPTTRKLRFVSRHYSTHLLRADWEQATPIGAKVEAELVRRALAALPKADAVVISDYAKGALTPRLIRAVIERARKLKIPVVVDPKGADFSIYRGATVITPNRKELREATGMAAGSTSELGAAARALLRKVAGQAVLVTLSENGMLLQTRSGSPIHVPAHPVAVRDVSGAGDTVTAVLAIMLGLGADLESAMRAANAGAAIAIGKRGTATVALDELRSRILPSAALAPEEKIVFDWRRLEGPLADWRAQDLRIGFTNGVFDILHPGHIKVLAQARSRCDRLVVGLNSDASVRRLKGPSRPIQDERARAEVLAALEAVDLVAVFTGDTPIDLIRRVRPSVLVKGGDYRVDQVVGRDVVEAEGGEVIVVDLVPGFSTTRIVERSRKRKPSRR
jgi:D-beta-D-heptose 7-phosphate kinase/D-beta-D-heptose 1-phosphate adenosyltransferase